MLVPLYLGGKNESNQINTLMKSDSKLHKFSEIIGALCGTAFIVMGIYFLFSKGFSIIRTFFLKGAGRWQWQWNSFTAWFSEGFKGNAIIIFDLLRGICALIVFLSIGYCVNKCLKDFFHLENPKKRGILTIILTLFIASFFVATMERLGVVSNDE